MSPQTTLQDIQFIDPAETLGRAVNLLQSVKPFAGYEFGTFVRVLMGQIRRRHYFFTLADDRPVGYVGWAMCTEQTARRWLDGGEVPTLTECIEGDCWLGITWYATDTRVCRHQVRTLKAIYPGKKAFGIRDYGPYRRSAMAIHRPAANTASPQRRTA